MEFSLLGWVGGFEKVILFYVFSCGLEKIALIGPKNGQTLILLLSALIIQNFAPTECQYNWLHFNLRAEVEF